MLMDDGAVLPSELLRMRDAVIFRPITVRDCAQHDPNLEL